MKIFAILGAPDPEMVQVERVLDFQSVPFGYATVDGNRVHPGNAYKANGVDGNSGDVFDQVLLVECGFQGDIPVKGAVVVIDHHRPGDPGYGLPPSDYWQGSSIGQIVQHLGAGELLGADILGEARLAAAADHCLGAAYKGQCPGISAEELMLWRARTRAQHQKMPVEEILDRISKARQQLASLPIVTIGESTFRDARDREIPELPEAAARDGVAVLYALEDRRSGRTKVGVLNGSREQIQDFLNHVEELGLIDPYGDPARGFAGAYRA